MRMKDMIGQVFRNNGKTLERALSEHIGFHDFHHSGDYVFVADLDEAELTIAIVTEPVDEAGKKIRVKHIIIY